MATSMSNLQLAGCMPCLLNRKSLTCLGHLCNLGINYFTLVLCIQFLLLLQSENLPYIVCNIYLIDPIPRVFLKRGNIDK